MRLSAKILLVLALLGAGSWWVWQHWQRYDFVNFPPTATGPWVAFGDSLTEGYGAGEGKDYPSVLGRRLGIRIVNLGKSGQTSADGLNRIEEVLALHPRVVLLCFGGNDELEQSSRARMFQNIGSMIDRFHAEGSMVVLIGIRSVSLKDQNVKSFRQLAKQKRVFHVSNILKGIFPKPVYMSDAVHPNDEGYKLIADRLEKELRPLTQKSKVLLN